MLQAYPLSISEVSRSSRLVRYHHKFAEVDGALPNSPDTITTESIVESNEYEIDAHEEWDYSMIHTDEGDLNPLRPCGACQEWLKKISECNPRFTVVTFTDHQCRGIYVNQIADD